MTRYELFKFLHIAGAIIWLGAGVGLAFLWRRLARAGDAGSLRAFEAQNSAMGKFLFGPATLLTLAFGVAMVVDSPIGFEEFWILIGFGGFIASGVAEGVFAGPAGKRFMAAAEEHGLDSPTAQAARRRVSLAGNIELLILFAVVWAMVVKPTI